MLNSISKNIGLLIFLLSLLFLVTSVLAGEVIVLGGQLVPAQTITEEQECKGKRDCCKAFYEILTEKGLTFIANLQVSTTIQPSHSSSRTTETVICSATVIANALANIFMYKPV